jgi:hypothetical protein
MHRLDICGLPDAPLDAAKAFYREWMERAAALADGDLTLVFPPADHTHRGWRLAAVQELARAAVPGRVNAVAGESDASIAAALRYLKDAPGVTGQYLPLDDAGAGIVIEAGA